jgi:hypothetical protein
VPINELQLQNIVTPSFHFKLDLSLVPTNPNFGQNLQKLKFYVHGSDGNNNFLLLSYRNVTTDFVPRFRFAHMAAPLLP